MKAKARGFEASEHQRLTTSCHRQEPSLVEKSTQHTKELSLNNWGDDRLPYRSCKSAK